MGVAITGATISVNGVKLFLTGGAAVITAPETGGTSLIIAIPEIIGGLAITAEGAAVCHVGTVTIASNMDSYNKTVQCLKDSSMVSGEIPPRIYKPSPKHDPISGWGWP